MSVPTGGIIFLTILALWAFYLVPVLVKERASRLDSRAADRTSPAVRVLQRPAAQRPSHRVVLTADRPLVSDDLPARPTRDLAVRLRAEARTARTGVRARAVGALVGVLALLVAGVSSALGVLPVWTLAVAGAWLAAVLASGAVAASARRRAAASPVSAAVALPPRAHRVATEVFDGRVARLSAPAGSAPAERAAARRPREVEAGAADEAWTPVEVPSPVYASKPVSHRPPTLPWSMPPAADATSGAGPDVVGAEPARGPGEDRAGAPGYDEDLQVEPVEERRSASA